MKTNFIIKRVLFVLALLCGCLLVRSFAAETGGGGASPGILQKGFKAWSTRDVSEAFDLWRKGGLLEDDAKPGKLVRYFNRLDRVVGAYRSFEVVETRRIGQSSQIVYVAINFEHGAVYGRFLIYQTSSDWVVQNMDFSVRPEAVIPQLTYTPEDYGE